MRAAIETSLHCNIESHGTGTRLGDPTEVRALTQALPNDGVRALGGVKASVGHLEPAAGMVRLFKLGLVVGKARSAPNAKLRLVNPLLVEGVRQKQLQLQVTSAQPVVGDLSARALTGGISSFGYSGTIAHAVLASTFTSGLPLDLPGSKGAAGVRFRRVAFPWDDMVPKPAATEVQKTSHGSAVHQSLAAGPLHTIVSHHVVHGRVIFPGAGYLEMARAALGPTGLHGVYFLQPLALEAPGLLVECTVSDRRFEVRSGEADAIEATTVHCSGATGGGSACWQRVDHAALRPPAAAADVGALYDGFHAVDLQYGPGYRTLAQAWGAVSHALARLRARSTHEGTQVHPADLDDALCTGGVVASSGRHGETRLPFAVDDAALRGAAGSLWAVRRLSRHDWLEAGVSVVHAWLTRVCCAPLTGRGCAERRGGVGAAWWPRWAATSAARRLQVARAAARAAGAAPPVRGGVAHHEHGGGASRCRACDRQQVLRDCSCQR